jgi:hypothetical protein
MNTERLETILRRINRAFARRRALGLPVGHLLTRVGPLSRAWLAAKYGGEK